MTKPTTATTSPPASPRRSSSRSRRSNPRSTSPDTARAATVSAVSKASTRPADPAWAAAIRAGLEVLRAAEQRHQHALDRLPLVREAEDDTRRAFAAVEAAADFGQGTDADMAHARQRAEAAEAERAKSERIAAGLAAVVEQHRDAVRPLVEPGRVGLMQWVEAELTTLDAEYTLAIEHTADIIARAVSVVDAVGATHLNDPLLRIRLPASLLRPTTALQVGSLVGMIQPAEGPASEHGDRLRALLDAARLATGSEGDRRAAADRAEQAAAAEHERAMHDTARDAEAVALAEAQRAKLGAGPTRDYATAEALA